MHKKTCFEWLQEWYQSQCDEDWEHSYGIKIETLDNPGWSVFIDLTETELEDIPFKALKTEISDTDWIHCLKKNNKFQGAGDPQKLVQIIEVFKAWVLSISAGEE
jgi:hypothetical protein